jgi:hypothetical protein
VIVGLLLLETSNISVKGRGQVESGRTGSRKNTTLEGVEARRRFKKGVMGRTSREA